MTDHPRKWTFTTDRGVEIEREFPWNATDKFVKDQVYNNWTEADRKKYGEVDPKKQNKR